MKVGIITGSGFYDFPELKEGKTIKKETEFGVAELHEAGYENNSVYFIARHGEGHKKLPNMINHRANILAMKELGVELIIATSVMGVLKSDIPLAWLMLFDDLYFPDNRLPDGEICSIFTEPGAGGNGHYIFGTPFSTTANDLMLNIISKF